MAYLYSSIPALAAGHTMRTNLSNLREGFYHHQKMRLALGGFSAQKGL
jgi:hypothetical protein